MRNNSVKLFLFGPVVQEEMPFKGISYLDIWQPFCSAECYHLCTFGRGHYEEQFFKIILNLGHRLSRCCNSERWHQGKHSCGVI